MEILQTQHTLVSSTAKMVYLLCPLRKSNFGIGKMTPINRCVECTYFEGLVVYEGSSVLPRVACQGCDSKKLKMLQLYGACKKHSRSINLEKYCNRKQCFYYKGIETQTGRLMCDSACSKPKIVPVLPLKTPNVNFPYAIPCPKSSTAVEIKQCLKCHFFKGLYGKSKICCEHYKAVRSEHVVPRSHIKVAPPRKTKSVSLQFLFQEFKPSKTIPLEVNCILHKTFEECTQCAEYRGVSTEGSYSNLKVNCAMFRTPIVYVKCPHTNASVTIPTCTKCAQHQGFKDSKDTCNTKVLCSFTKIEGYVSKAPTKAKVQHYYYDIPD